MRIHFYSFKRMTMLILAISCLCYRQAQAQKYASSQTNGVTGVCLLCSVVNPDNPVNNASLDDYSTFVITAGLLGVTVHQTLIFSSVSNIGCDSLVIGIGSGNALLSANICGGVSVQTFNGNIPNNDARGIDTSVLRLLQGNTRAEIVLRPTQAFDRVKITLSSNLLGLLNTFRVYYAYRHSGKPDNPVYNVPQGTVCDTVALHVLNHRAGVYYMVRVKYQSSGGVTNGLPYRVNSDTIVVTSPPPNLAGTVTATVTVEAIDTSTGCGSEAVCRTFTYGARGETPSVDADSVRICKGDSATLHAFSANAGSMLIRWYDAPAGGNRLCTDPDYMVRPDTTTTYYAAGAFDCEHPQRRPVKVIVNNKPADPVYNVPEGIVCGNVTIPVLNHREGVYYRVRVMVYKGHGFGQTYLIHSGTIALLYSYNVVTTMITVSIQAVDSLTGCKSNAVEQILYKGGTFPWGVDVDADSVVIHKGDSTTLHAYSLNADTMLIHWYDAPAGGNLLHTGEYYTVRPDTTTTYYAVDVFLCGTPVRTPVKVVVRPDSFEDISGHRFAPGNRPTIQPIKLFPNPTTGEVKINSNKALNGALLSVFDLHGREVKRMILNSNTLRLEGASGMYIIKVITRTGEIYQSRILLQK